MQQALKCTETYVWGPLKLNTVSSLNAMKMLMMQSIWTYSISSDCLSACLLGFYHSVWVDQKGLLDVKETITGDMKNNAQ